MAAAGYTEHSAHLSVLIDELQGVIKAHFASSGIPRDIQVELDVLARLITTPPPQDAILTKLTEAIKATGRFDDAMPAKLTTALEAVASHIQSVSLAMGVYDAEVIMVGERIAAMQRELTGADSSAVSQATSMSDSSESLVIELSEGECEGSGASQADGWRASFVGDWESEDVYSMPEDKTKAEMRAETPLEFRWISLLLDMLSDARKKGEAPGVIWGQELATGVLFLNDAFRVRDDGTEEKFSSVLDKVKRFFVQGWLQETGLDMLKAALTKQGVFDRAVVAEWRLLYHYVSCLQGSLMWRIDKIAELQYELGIVEIDLDRRGLQFSHQQWRTKMVMFDHEEKVTKALDMACGLV